MTLSSCLENDNIQMWNRLQTTSVKWQHTYKEHKIEQAEQVFGHRSTTVVRHFLVSASCVQSVVVLHENFKACKIKWVYILFPMAQQPLVGQGVLVIKASRSHSDTPLLVGLLWTSDQPDAQTATWQHTTLTRDRHPYQWIWFSILHLLGDQTQITITGMSGASTGINWGVWHFVRLLVLVTAQ